jgi:hypothetical protein
MAHRARRQEDCMLMTGQDYLESIRDGRRVYIGSTIASARPRTAT